MTPFTRVTRDASLAMLQRAELIAQPNEFFKDFFGGRVPTVQEKLFWVEEAVARMAVQHLYENDLYHVQVDNAPPFIHLTIQRHDGEPCKEWSHLQRIKNELIGPEHEAVELFPAESRLIDAVNQYHLWVHADAGFRFPLGFNGRRFVLKEPLLVETKNPTLSGPPRMMGTDSTFAAPVLAPARPHAAAH